MLVRQSSLPGELVIDPFMGSGSTGVAAARHGRDFAGNDLCAEAVEIARARMLELAEPSLSIDEARVSPSAPQLGLGLDLGVRP